MWYAEERLRRLIILVIGLGVWLLACTAVMGPGLGTKVAVLAALGVLLYYLHNTDRRAFWLLLGAVALFALGYSTYAALYVRSGLNPVIDENDPETLAAFIKFINREQYGTESQLLGLFTPRADRAYQFWHQQMKYFFQQFPFPLLGAHRDLPLGHRPGAAPDLDLGRPLPAGPLRPGMARPARLAPLFGRSSPCS